MQIEKHIADAFKRLGVQPKYLLALALIFAVGFLLRMANTAKSPYLVKGIDGPYYISQVDYLVETGKLLHKDSPLAFYYLFLWRLLLGDTVKALKIGMSVITGLMCLPTFFVARRIARDDTVAILSAFLSVFNPYLFEMTYNLYKNEIGLLLLLTFFVLFFRLVSADGVRRKWKTLVILLLVFIALWATHIMATGMAVLFSISYFVVAVFRDREAAKRALKLSAVVGVIAGCALLVLAAAFPASFYKVYKLGFLTDLIQDESEAPRFAPAQAQGSWARFIAANLDPVRWFGIPAIAGLIVLIGKVQKRNLLLSEAFILSTYVSWLAFVQPSISRDLLWRFTLASFVPLCLIMGYGLAAIQRKLPYMVAMPAVVLLLGLSFMEASCGAMRSSTTITQGAYLELLEIRELVPEECAIVGMAGDAYWYEAVLQNRIISSTYVESEDYSDEARLYIVAAASASRGGQGNPGQGNPGQPIGPGTSPLPTAFPGSQRLSSRAELIYNGRYLTAYLLPAGSRAQS